MQVRSILISIFLIFFSLQRISAQCYIPQEEGEKIPLGAKIEMEKGYISGSAMLLHKDGEIKGSVFNEFGISAIDFSYDLKKKNVKIYSIIGMLDKWYIKKVIKKDLAKLMQALQEGKTTYVDEKYKITYTFEPMSVIGAVDLSKRTDNETTK